MYSSVLWKEYFKRINRTKSTFLMLDGTCEDILASMHDMTDILLTNIKKVHGEKEFLPYQQFVSIYFVRNIVYLKSAYLLSCGAFCGPSRDIQRTVYETILRGYLFIVDHKEANHMYNYINGTINSEELDMLQRRKFWPFDYLMKRLFHRRTRKMHKKLYEELSRSSHPSIKGVYHDLEYSEDQVNDCLNVILSFGYGNMQMMAEGFYDFLDSVLKVKIKESLLQILDILSEKPLLEPDLEEWSSKIRLKKGNFLQVLGN